MRAWSRIQICSELLRHGVNALAISQGTVQERHNPLLLLGVEALLKPLSPDRAVRTIYYQVIILLQCRTHTKEKPLFETTINLGEQVSSLIIKMCYLGAIRAGKDSLSLLLISPVIPIGMIQNPSDMEGFDVSFCLFFTTQSHYLKEKIITQMLHPLSY